MFVVFDCAPVVASPASMLRGRTSLTPKHFVEGPHFISHCQVSRFFRRGDESVDSIARIVGHVIQWITWHLENVTRSFFVIHAAGNGFD